MRKDVLTLEKITEVVKPIALKYQVEEIYLFDSYTRGEATVDSDLDFLVFGGDFFKKTLIFALAEELSKAFQKTVDVLRYMKLIRIAHLMTRLWGKGFCNMN